MSQPSIPERVASAGAALRDSEPAARDRALATLEKLYVTCESGTCVTDAAVARMALPHAKHALADPDPGVRVAGARAIELFAGDAGEAITELATTIVDPSLPVRLAALEALCEAGEGAAVVAEALADRLANAATAEERSAAAVALGNAGAQAEHLDVLLVALLEDVPSVQASAAHALGMALDDPRDDRREVVSKALHRLSGTRGASD